jgi:acetyl-CoA synthetase
MAMAEVQERSKPAVETSEDQIAVHWREEGYYYPSAKFVGQANLTDPSVTERFSEKNFPEGGKINASYNCVDRHLAKYKNKAALIFVPEPESEATVSVTYRELYVRVNEFAALLRDFCGLKSGDRVTIHMPMVPELPITMLACARLGVIHSVVFGGFSGEACGTRAADSGSRVLITMDGYFRNGKMIDHKAGADIALEVAKKEGQVVDKVLVWRRHPGKNASASPFVKGRDVFVDEVLPNYAGHQVAPIPMDAEAPLFLMYTSGSTGKPKG